MSAGHVPHAPLLPRRVFARHAIRNALIPVGFIIGWWALGIAGYHLCGGLAWIDALVNASMILSGMGPVDPIASTGGKVFTSLYAVFSGVAFLTTVALVLSPFVHRIMHRFHFGPSRPTE